MGEVEINMPYGRATPPWDWDYAQTPTMGTDRHLHGTTWHILFDMANVSAGKATLHLAICGSRGNSVDVSVNGRPIGTTGALPNSGVMHRDGIRSIETKVDLPFDSLNCGAREKSNRPDDHGNGLDSGCFVRLPAA